MLIGIGVDTVDVDRFQENLKRTPALKSRLFTEAEQALPIRSLAARFAAKEALIKALGGSDGIEWHDLEVEPSRGVRPTFTRTDALVWVLGGLGAAWPHLSITHDGGFATAFVIVESASA